LNKSWKVGRVRKGSKK